MINRLRLTLCLLLLACALNVHAQQQPEFPELTGRVVDQAELLDSQQEARLSQMLEAHEQATTEQVVVVTLPDLQGNAIDDYGYQLGRHWGIGQEGEDNGALLIVAMEEQAIRIEVGYGLEGRLTDAQSSVIISQIISPAFQQGDYAQGLIEGAEAMIQVLGGEPLEAQPGAGARAGDTGKESGPMSMLFFVMFVIVMAIVRGGGGGRGRGRGRGGLLTGALLGAALGRGSGGGGGFGGGGGGFGGGGASGGW